MIVTCNAGSSNIKLALYDGQQRRAQAQVATREEALAWIGAQPREITAFSHRVVHGGREFSAPVRVDARVLAALEALTPLAPLHQPASLALMRTLMEAHPDASHIACFDTAFHHTLPPLEKRLPLPASYAAQGLERYGFHGLSYQSIAERLPGVTPARKVIAAHLGNGASMCAMVEGKSCAVSMGFSTLDGLMMGTRCGSLDPGAVLHLVEKEGMEAASRLLYRESGLKGVSGIGNDVRELLASDEPQAREALALFAYTAAKWAGALAVAIGGMEALVFSGGIGERAAAVRAAICEHLAWLGVELNERANTENAERISAEKSAIGVYILPADEDEMLAQAARSMARSSSNSL